MTRKSGDRPLDELERRFQTLRDQIGASPKAGRPELETALQGVSQAIAALRAAGASPPAEALDGPEAADAPASADTILRQVFSAVPDMLTVIDRDFNIIMTNWHESGMVPEEARRDRPKCYRVFHHRDRPCEACHVQKVFASGQPQKTEKINLLDGRTREFSAFPVQSESGQVILAAEHVRDVTERHRAAEALKESEERFRMLFEYAPDAYFLMDLQGNFLDVNRGMEGLTGYGRAELIGRNYQALPLLDDRQNAMVAALLQQAVNGKILGPVELNLNRKDGGNVIIEAKGLPLHRKGESLLLGIARDITAWKLAEEELVKNHLELQEITQRLGQSRNMLQLIIESIPMRVFWKDSELRYMGCNTLLARDAGFNDPQQLLGQDDFAMGWREQADLYRADDRQVMESGRPKMSQVEPQTTPAGAKIWLKTSKVPLQMPDGEVFGVLGVYEDITTHKEAEEALKKSEATLRGLIEANPESLFLLDREGVVLAASKVAAQRLGTSLEEIIGVNLWALLPPEIGQKRLEIFQKVVASGVPARFEDARGDFYFDSSMSPIFDQDQVVQVAVLGVNISLRKQAEAALQASEARFRAIFDHTLVGVSMSDLAGRILQTNQALQQMLGYSAEELRCMSFQEVTHPEDLGENLRLQEELIAGKSQHYALEKRYFRKDGKIVWVHIKVALLRDDRGEPQYLLATVIDRTARKQAGEDLRKSEQRFRLMAETIQEVFWIATPTLDRVIYASPAYEQVWGYSCQDLYQHPQRFVESIHPEDRDRALAAIVTAREQGSASDHEYRIIKPDGAVRWIHDRGFPVRDDQGRVILFTGVASDITGRKALEQQLLQSQKMDAVGRLAGGIAHDFNNLLMAITGYGELMRSKVLKDDPLYSHLENILKASDRATALTQQLLTFSRQKVIHPQMVDLNRVVLDLEPMLRRLIGEDLDLEVVTDLRLGAVKADPSQLGQIIMNLVVNARDAMPQGGRLTLKTATVNFTVGCHNRFGLTPPGAYVRLEVQDTGVGMDEATQAHIFEPFFTTKEPGKGTGLGLSIVYGIVTQSGGYLDLESSPGAGSTFTIYFPRLEAIIEPPKAKIPLTASFRGEETVLLVEDEDVLRGLLAKFLRLYGYTVLEARHGGEALLACERHQGPIHLMVTDVVMPKMSGRELADRLTPLRPEMKIIYMSGYTEETLVQHGVADLSVSFLQKPFRPIELARRIHAVLHPPVSR